MSSNQGLDALAALAAAATPTTNSAAASANGEGLKAKLAGGASAGDMNASSSLPPASSMVPPLSGITSQQWQQAVATAAASINALAGGVGNPNNLLGMVNHGTASNNPSLLAMQQQIAMQQHMNYYQLLAQASSQQRSFSGSQGVSSNMVPPPTAIPMDAATSQALSLALAGQSALPTVNGASPINAQSGGVLPSAPSASQHVSVSTVGFSSPSTSQPLLAAIAPQPSKPRSSNVSSNNELSDDDHAAEDDYFQGDKRLMKRVANRRSAQLSRKRKKQFIEELKEENDGLRRKELILKSIPDLVVVFDSTGKLWFVSESVSRFLDFNADELVGTSFWSRLCEDSVRLLKAAFMDSLAARQHDSETAALGEGIWELRLVDKDGSHKVITLNGVVHFAGDRPECVCSIRPRDDGAKGPLLVTRVNDKTRHETVSTSSAASISSTSLHHKSSSYLQPHQSVLSAATMKHEPHRSDAFPSSRRGAVRISDCGNSSGSSESSGSGDDERNAEAVK